MRESYDFKIPYLITLAALTAASGSWECALAQSQEASGEPSSLSEIVVTAQRRVENAQTVPVSLQVLSGAELDQLGAGGFEDYLGSLSSVGYTKSGNGAVQIGIRGVSNVDGTDYGIGVSKSAVGLYLNDIPMQGAGPLPDLDLYDLSRIEVLKGPQGTLYGEGAMGGAIKMILNPASLTDYAVKADTAVSDTSHGGVNDDVRASVNFPLIQNHVGLRLTATYRDDSGFIHDVATGLHHVGADTTDSFRALLDAAVTDRFSSQLLFLHQHLEEQGFPEESVGFGELESNVPDHEYNGQSFDLYGGTIKYRFDMAELISSTAYTKNDRRFYQRTPFVGLYDGGALLDFGLPGVAETEPQGFSPTIDQKALTEEIRLASANSERIAYTVGGYFRNSEQDAVSFDTLPNYAIYNTEMQAAAADPASQFNAALAASGGTLSQALFASATDVYENVVNEHGKQYAVFGESDFKITPDLSIKAGLRWFTERNDIAQFNQALAIEALDFALYGVPATARSAASITDHGVVPRFGISYNVDRDLLVYALASKGFRSGGPNFNDGQASIPALYKSDSLWNYEAGVKSSWFDRRLIANAALYYIDWKNVQVPAVTGGVSYIANSGDARIRGGEFQLQALLGLNWRVGANLGLLDSRLNSVDTAAAGVLVGQPLPNSPKVTTSEFLEYSHPAGSLGSVTARFDYQYVGREAVQLITNAVPLNTFFKSGYQTGRIQAGVQNPRWSAYLFVDNIWDERGVLQEKWFMPAFQEETLTLIRPRTVGVRMGFAF